MKVDGQETSEVKVRGQKSEAKLHDQEKSSRCMCT